MPARLRTPLLVAALVLPGLLARPAFAADPRPSPEDDRFFETRIRPVLADRCFECHGPEKQKAALRLDSAEAIRKGGDSGRPLVVPGKPDEGLLLRAVRHADGVEKMPPDGKLKEPEIADLCAFLTRMGARIVGGGTSTIEIEGVDELSPVDHTVIPDRIEAGTFLAAVGVAGGEVTLHGARADHMDMLIRKLGEMGMRVSPSSDGLWVQAKGRLDAVDVSTLPYPGIATDYKPFFVAMLAVADGVGIVTENLFAGRFRYVDELVRMGAEIRTEGHHAVVRGVPRLSGAPVRAPDIRAGAALVVAALGAEGETVVSDAWHVARGYEDFAGKLRGLGADIDTR